MSRSSLIGRKKLYEIALGLVADHLDDVGEEFAIRGKLDHLTGEDTVDRDPLRLSCARRFETGDAVDRFTVAFTVFVAWLALAAVYLRTWRASTGNGVQRATLIGLFVLTMALHVGLLLSFITRFTHPEAASAFWRVLTVQMAAALPGGEMALWILCALVFAAAYLSVQRSFERIEMPAPKSTRVD